MNWGKQVDLYPYDMKGMDYYSTALWHLKKAKELTLLSQHCSEMDKLSCATWMVMGNCFSLHKSHDLAIKYFQKAYSTQSDYAYAYTLAGHEFVVNEDFDSAFKSFSAAIRIDERHYNAWYGLANIYQFQQDYKNALWHFNKARQINPNSSVLYVCISNIHKLQSRYKIALQFVDKALSLTQATGHHNLKARLEKANIFILMNEYEKAIDEFKYLLQIIPNEWKIHFHLGEVYLMIKNKDKALLSFNRAMALNPKDKNTIKHAIQNVYAENDGDTKNQKGPRTSNPKMGKHSVYQSGMLDEDDDDDDDDNERERIRRRRLMHMGGFGDVGYRESEVESDDNDDDMLDDSELDDVVDNVINSHREQSNSAVAASSNDFSIDSQRMFGN